MEDVTINSSVSSSLRITFYAVWVPAKKDGSNNPAYLQDFTTSDCNATTYTQSYLNASSPSDSGTNYRTSSSVYGYGNYYTWAAAMANTNYFNNSSTPEAAGTSICPSNWHLPSSNGTAKEYGTLSQGYGGSGSGQTSAATGGDVMDGRFRTFPNNFLHSGYFTSTIYGRGVSSSYWSRSANTGYNSYFLNLGLTELYPSKSTVRQNGFSVRCLIGS